MGNFTKKLGGNRSGVMKVLLVVVGMVWGFGAWGATRYSVATGNWNATSTWSTSSGGTSGASVPANGDVVFIEGGFTVTLTSTMATTRDDDNGYSEEIAVITNATNKWR
jgi:hypothetical protein